MIAPAVMSLETALLLGARMVEARPEPIAATTSRIRADRAVPVLTFSGVILSWPLVQGVRPC